MSLVMSLDQEGRERRLRELANRLGDEDQVKRESANRTNHEYANIKQDLTQEINMALKKFENI